MMNLFTLGFKVSSEGFDELQGRIDSVTDAVGGLAAVFTSLKTIEIGKVLVSEFAEAETQSMRLRAAIEGIGGNYAKLRPEIDATIDSMMQLTTIEDDAASGALARLIATTRDMEKSLRALKVAQEFAARGMMDLEGAAVLVGKAVNGNTAMLGRYGIVVDDTRDVLTQLEEAFTGVAEAQAQTLGGAMVQSQVQLGNFREALGEAIAETFNLDGVLRSLTNGLRSTNGEFSPLATSFVVAVGTVGTLTTAVYGLAAAFVTLRGALVAAGGTSLIGMFKDPRVLTALAVITVAVGAYSYATTKAADAQSAFAEELSKKSVGLLEHEKRALENEIKVLEARKAESMRKYSAAFTGDLDEAKKKLEMYTRAIEEAAQREKQALISASLAAKQAEAERAIAAAKAQEAEEKAFQTRLKLANMTTLNAESLRLLADEATRYEQIASRANTSEAERLRLLERAKQIRGTLAEQSTTERVTLGSTSKTMQVQAGFSAGTVAPSGGLAAFEQQVDQQLTAGRASLAAKAEEFKVDVNGIVNDITNSTILQFLEMRQRLTEAVESSLSNVLGDSIYEAFASAFRGEGLSGLFENFGRTVLSGLGKMFVMLGQYMIAASGIFKAIAKALMNPISSGYALAAYGVALIALGAGMGAIATRGANSGASSPAAAGGGVGGGFEGSNQRILFGASSGTVAAGMTPRDNLTINLIGKDDPRAQRELLELINNGQQRGMV